MPPITEHPAKRAVGLLLLAILMGGAGPAAADAPAREQAAQLTGLFLQSCVRFVGNRDGLRGWAKGVDLVELPAAGQAAFLSGHSGKVFDASNASGKFVIVSPDDGKCSTIAQQADGAAVVVDLERSLRAAGIAVALAAEQEDPAETAVRHREYNVSQDRQAWRVLVSTVVGGPGMAMLTASP